MRVEASTVTVIWLSDIQPGDDGFGKLDPIDVILQNHRPGAGEITIKCFGKSWTAFWGAMSGKSVQEFFVGCDDDYLIKNLCQGISPTVRVEFPDWVKVFKQAIEQQRLDGMLSREEAQEFLDEVELRGRTVGIDPEQIGDDRVLLERVTGDPDWWEFWPEEDNSDYVYLKRIVRAVRKGLKQWMNQTTSEPCVNES